MVTDTSFIELVFDVPLDRTFTYRPDDKAASRVGVRVMAPFGKREVLGYVVAENVAAPLGLSESAIKKVRRVVDAEPLFGKDEIELARWMAGFYLCGAGEALAAMIPSGRREIAPPAFAEEDFSETGSSLALSSEQEAALEALSTPSTGQAHSIHYLYGITGSGKTEVFLRAAERCLAEGKSVIYLVPEISLTHQVIDVVAKRFGPVAATLHSGMTPSARLAEWTRIRRGEARVVVGPRSAVFAPVFNLGLIVIDEEHDGSYKSGNVPRYHARQVALKRCAALGARLVMGSATPSSEAWKLMSDGQVSRFDLTKRLSGGAPPKIKIVDLAGTEGCLSQELKEEIKKTAEAGRQTILFLNRRGFSYFYRCRSCGYELTCKRCSVSLTYHKSKGRALCHYCGYSAPIPTSCPECGSLDASFAGFGTEMIEEEVTRTFPELRIRRADADAVQKKGGLK
ncbi:MAG: primosomal protein N', partial [Treponemataceae bacterium]